MKRLLSVAEEDVAAPASVVLRSALTHELAVLYDANAAGTAGFDPADVGDDGAFVVARVDGRPVGCGALVRYDAARAELKRLFVIVPERGRGVGRALVAALESRALELGYAAVRLETGDKQHEAIALYGRLGYQRIDPWGAHATTGYSVCMEKGLT